MDQESHDQVFRALADGTRRRILDHLAEGEATVTELMADATMTQSAVSQHLRVLRGAALVEERRAGRHRVYRLRPETLQPARDWIAAYERFWEERLDRLGSVLRGKHGTQD
ncbi:metalloregulator ArsR/SmtB family transcription factor [Polymorphobacter sp. PAMC 29334]|uniref:ArsR/SmtB family transcription factor n=1 Tax=Polymorphobacter sp. PAMC 29334 TaxID=2862331 RepID=UPI001C77247B|nr:metalloregulator ArsR/SmtB family transcription factor [Polymorphobacter sp. PAMC 29334]QYE36223.1 metalloregulator ArsR/SmtB family transcription factor [Polymorphobacter sp. PAMC 29334]